MIARLRHTSNVQTSTESSELTLIILLRGDGQWVVVRASSRDRHKFNHGCSGFNATLTEGATDGREHAATVKQRNHFTVLVECCNASPKQHADDLARVRCMCLTQSCC